MRKNALSSTEEARREAAGALTEGVEDEGGVLAYLQADLWDQLIEARRSSMSGVWSIRCGGIVHRLVWLTKHTQKPTPWGNVPMDLLIDGTYEAIHEAIGMPTPLTDEQRAEVVRLVDERDRRHL